MTPCMPVSSPRILRALIAAAITAAALATTAAPAHAERTPTGVLYHHITFPVAATVHYSDDFGDCREGCTRHHMGNDLLGAKLMHEVAASAGTIAWVHADNTGTAGNMLQLTGDDGWVYWYIHINNDTPGTDDGKNPKKWILAPGIHAGSKVKAGQFVSYMGDSGDAESTQPHLHFEIHMPNGTVIDPYTSLRLAQGLPADGLCSAPSNPAADPSPTGGHGYWTLGARGGLLGFGSARVYPAQPLPAAASAPAVAIAATATGKGYWLTDAAGVVRTFGDARSNANAAKPDVPIVGISATPSGKGYWLVGRDGSVFPYGDARAYGSTRGMHLNAPVIAMAPTQTGHGYWLLAKDGGVFTFGDAKFFGSTGSTKLNAPIIGMGAAAGGHGYWLLARDGGMFSFGGASFYGSLPGLGWCPGAGQAVAFTSTRTGDGYWVVLADGRVVAFGDAKHYGDAPRGARLVAFAVAA
jgi:murein DD-endopeptidase MepM/ murein hydrolase activator NlpD